MQLAMSAERFALLSLDLEVEVEVEVVVKEEADVAVVEDGLTAEATVAAAGFLAQSQAPVTCGTRLNSPPLPLVGN